MSDPIAAYDRRASDLAELYKSLRRLSVKA
jgi:hypothetical protein